MIYDTSIAYDNSGCCAASAPEPVVPPYEPPAPAPLPVPVSAPATTWIDEPVAAAPAPLVIEPAPVAAPAPAPLVIEPAPVAAPAPAPTGISFVITSDPAASVSPGIDWHALDAMLIGAGADLGGGPAMPLPAETNPSLWSSTPTADGLFPTSDVDRDGIDNASDNAPFTAAPRRP